MNRDGNGVATAGSTGDIYDRIAGLLPEENREGFLKHVARIRDFHENDEILMLVEACGYFALLSGTVPESIIFVSKRLKAWIRKIAKRYIGGQSGYIRHLIERDKKAREEVSAAPTDDNPKT